MKVYPNLSELMSVINGFLRVEPDGRCEVTDESALKRELPNLVYTAVFGDGEVKEVAGRAIVSSAMALGIYPWSIADIYFAIPKLNMKFTTPAINLRTLPFLSAKAAFQLMIENDAFPVIFELARSEMGYTDQTPLEYTANILAAAIDTGYRGPVFLQGDHFQFSRAKFSTDPESERQAIRDLIVKALDAGFYNIDIDASTLVDLEKPSLKEQQYLNYTLTAEMTAFIRQHEPEGVSVAVGGEIGEVGGKNSTPEDLRAFLEGYFETLRGYGDMIGLAKVSVQTGTTHGGVVLPDGSIAKVKIDFNVHKVLSKILREEYGIGGTVQHGASTLPDELFDKFPESDAIEIHLATGFQNIVYDYMPADLREEIYKWLKENRRHEWKEGQTEQQFIYKTRKRALGPFKRAIWNMPQDIKDKIFSALKAKFNVLFSKLGIYGKRSALEKLVNPKPIWKPLTKATAGTVSSAEDLAD